MTDFNRTKLGLGINVAPTSVNLADVLADELDELRAVHPDRQIELKCCRRCQNEPVADAAMSRTTSSQMPHILK